MKPEALSGTANRIMRITTLLISIFIAQSDGYEESKGSFIMANKTLLENLQVAFQNDLASESYYVHRSIEVSDHFHLAFGDSRSLDFEKNVGKFLRRGPIPGHNHPETDGETYFHSTAQLDDTTYEPERTDIEHFPASTTSGTNQPTGPNNTGHRNTEIFTTTSNHVSFEPLAVCRD